MRPLFEELDFRPTPLGDLILRRRQMTMLDDLIVYEVLLGDAFLMSSLFHDVEEALADLGLAATEGDKLDVGGGGLGLGYTAVAALRDPRVAELLVVDTLAPHQSSAPLFLMAPPSRRRSRATAAIAGVCSSRLESRSRQCSASAR